MWWLVWNLPGRSKCDEKGQCVCNHACKEGEKSCVDGQTAERCELDNNGCRVMRKTKCDAVAGKCNCQNECPKVGDRQCLNDPTKTKYKECLKDTSGCLYWSTSRTCAAGIKCINNTCCKPNCTNRECGSDGCGGTCGKCGYGCVNNLCRRVVLTVSIYLACSACDDKPALWGADPDPYVKLTLSNGTTYKTSNKDNKCNETVTFNWTVVNLDPAHLKNAKIEILDYDSLNSDDACGSYSGDLSKVGKRTISGSKSSKFTIEVKK